MALIQYVIDMPYIGKGNQVTFLQGILGKNILQKTLVVLFVKAIKKLRLITLCQFLQVAEMKNQIFNFCVNHATRKKLLLITGCIKQKNNHDTFIRYRACFKVWSK